MNDYLQDLKKRIFNRILGISNVDYLEQIYQLVCKLDAEETRRNMEKWSK